MHKLSYRKKLVSPLSKLTDTQLLALHDAFPNPNEVPQGIWDDVVRRNRNKEQGCVNNLRKKVKKEARAALPRVMWADAKNSAGHGGLIDRLRGVCAEGVELETLADHQSAVDWATANANAKDVRIVLRYTPHFLRHTDF